ncbi:unnamed protein product, partial [Sphagnum jensenii]
MDEDPCELPNSDSPLLLLLHPDKELWSTPLAMPCDGSIQLSKSTWFTCPATSFCHCCTFPLVQHLCTGDSFIIPAKLMATSHPMWMCCYNSFHFKLPCFL